MLRELAIKNFAIIDDLRIAFLEGLTILTGETGAGKSMILSAVNLLLGSRASAQLVRAGMESAELEAFFEVAPNSPTAQEMEAMGLDVDEGLLIRRQISIKDRHRVYVNNRLSTMGGLQKLTRNLASISGQHAHQRLLEQNEHLLIVDQFGGLLELREQVAQKVRGLAALQAQMAELEGRRKRQDDQRELLSFQKDEIESAGLEAGEDLALEKEQRRLKNAEQLMRKVHTTIEGLYAADGAVVEQMGRLNQELAQAASLDASLDDCTHRLGELMVQVEDVAADLRSYIGGVELDPAHLEQVEERIDRINRLKRKYGDGVDQILEHLETIGAQLEEVDTLDEQIAQLAEKQKRRHREVAKIAKMLSQKRNRTARDLSRLVESELAQLNMPQVRFAAAIRQEKQDPAADPLMGVDGWQLGATGVDHAEFLIAPNAGEGLKPLAAIASGGELSRAVLALKAILAQVEAVGTIVFDEVDAGIGGATAEVVGQKIAQLADRHQVLCITHLPQIAKFADHHFMIRKEVNKGRTRTVIEPVAAQQRVEELARMLGGTTITEKTRDHARELLRQ